MPTVCSPFSRRPAAACILLGSKPGIAELAAQKMLEKHPKLHICGMTDGYFKDEAPIIEKINAARPDVLFVCLGAPKQELFMKDHLDELPSSS